MTSDVAKPYQVRRLAFEYEEMLGTFKSAR